MRYVLIVLCAVCLLGMGRSSVVSAEQGGQQVAQLHSREPDTEFKERAAKRRKYIACYEAGKGKCYERYTEAVKWCQENWEKCFPLIPGLGVHAGAYGKQELDKCKAQLRNKCRGEAGL